MLEFLAHYWVLFLFLSIINAFVLVEAQISRFKRVTKAMDEGEIGDGQKEMFKGIWICVALGLTSFATFVLFIIGIVLAIIQHVQHA